jgi:hypothetical protein
MTELRCEKHLQLFLIGFVTGFVTRVTRDVTGHWSRLIANSMSSVTSRGFVTGFVTRVTRDVTGSVTRAVTAGVAGGSVTGAVTGSEQPVWIRWAICPPSPPAPATPGCGVRRLR